MRLDELRARRELDPEAVDLDLDALDEAPVRHVPRRGHLDDEPPVEPKREPKRPPHPTGNRHPGRRARRKRGRWLVAR